MFRMPTPEPHDAIFSVPSLPRKYVVALLIGAGLLLSWIFSGYFSPQILIDFVMRYCA
jgi:hypothetical protein